VNVEQRKVRAARISVLSNTTLVVGKLTIGLLTGSVSVVSEAIHSAVDLLAAAIALFAVRSASKPADTEHPYGHGKIENLSGTIEALLIFVAAGWIIYEAVHKLIERSPVEMAGLGVAVMGFSAVVNYYVSRMLFRVGVATDSIALQADAWHLRTDVWTSVGVMLGLGLIVGSRLIGSGIDLWWIDPVAAIGVALLIIKAAYDLTRQSLRDVLDESLPEGERQWIGEEARAFEGVLGLHGLRTRKAGQLRFIEFHLLVEPDMSVLASHDLAHRVSARIKERFEQSSVTVHVEPCDGACEPHCVSGCTLDAGERAARRRASRPRS